MRSEALITARLEHPGIVPSYGLIEDAAMQPCFVMRFVKAPSLADEIDEFDRKKSLTAGEVSESPGFQQLLERYLGVCRTVAYAHREGVIHRDLKPENVKVGDFGVTLVMDWGIAKDLRAGEVRPGAFSESSDSEAAPRASSDDTEAPSPSGLTAGALGTRYYMAPEQAAGRGSRVGPQSDVYSLGGILYTILTGRPPVPDAAGQIKPPRQGERSRWIPRALESICLKAMQSDPDRRYRDAGEIVEEILRWRSGRQVQAYARSETRGERLARWGRRNKGWLKPTAAVASVSILLILALVLISSQQLRVQRDAAVSAENVALREKAQAERNLRLAETRQCQYQHQLAGLQLQATEFDAAGAALSEVPDKVSSWDTGRMRYMASFVPAVSQVLADGHWGIVDAALGADGARLVSCDASGRVLVWDVVSGRMVRRLVEGRWEARLGRWRHYAEVRSGSAPSDRGELWVVGLSRLGASGRFAAAALDGRGMWFDAQTGQQGELLHADAPLYEVASSADGDRVLFGGASGIAYLVSPDGRLRRDSKVSRSPITAIVWNRWASEWIVGREDGSLERLDKETLQVRGRAEVEGPVWDLDVAEATGGSRLAVGCQSPQVALFRLTPAGELTRIAAIPLPQVREAAHAVHSVRFSPDGKRLYVLDDLGRLLLGDEGERQWAWTIQAIRRDPRLAVLRKSAGKGDGSDWPPPLRRTGRVLPIMAKPDFLMLMGEDAVLKTWNVGEAVRRGIVRLSTSAGPQPRVAFDPHHPEVLWALDRTGVLRAIDTRKDRLLDRTQAHSGGAADLAIDEAGGSIVSVGGDSSVRFWTLTNSRIRPAHLKSIPLDRPLMGVAVSPESRWLATVDEKAGLRVCDFRTGKRLFAPPVGEIESGKPVTGRVAFNGDGTRLCAFGAGQSAHLFATKPFERLHDQPWVAGTGGTALVWNPLDAGSLLVADDYPRCVIYAPTPDPTSPRPPGIRPESPCVAAVATPDHRRIVLLEAGGRVVFFDSQFYVELWSFRSGLGKCRDLAFDRAGRRLAVAGDMGDTEIYDTAAAPDAKTPAIEDQTAHWVVRRLVEPSPDTLRTDQRSIATDAKNRCCLLYTDSRPGDVRDEGARFFVRDEGTHRVGEPLAIDGGPLDRHVAPLATALSILSNGEPAAELRRRTAVLGPYDGSVHLGTRQGDGRWAFTRISEHGNDGHYAVLAPDSAGGIREMFHFTFADYSLLRSTPAAPGAEWHHERLGIQGDGMHFVAVRDRKGTTHFVFRPSRYNNDPTPHVYARWDGKSFFREVIDPRADVYESLALAPDQTPVVMVRPLGGARGRPHGLVHRTPQGWVPYAKLPPDPDRFRGKFMLNAEGEPFLVSWNADQQRVLLWHGHADQWSVQAVAQKPAASAPNWWAIRLDQRDRPMIVLARMDEPYGWIVCLRPKAAGKQDD